MDIKARTARRALLKTIADPKQRTPELMVRALTELREDSSQVDARQLAKAMGEGWGQALLPGANELLSHKKGSERLKALELFAAIADPATVPQLEAAKTKDRSKKLHSQYDYAIRRIVKASAELARVKVDPTDASIDPVERLVELANMDLDAFEAIKGVSGGWNVSYALDWADFDSSGRKPFAVGEETWHFVFTGDAVRVEKPGGKQTKSMPKACGDDAKEAFKALKKRLKAAQKKRHTRLEESFVTGETWPAWLWRLLYVEHPLADHSAHTLVFEVVDGKKRHLFAVTDEGTLVDANLDAVALDSAAAVRVAHPADMDAEALSAWQQQATDGEWQPPFQQLHINLHSAVNDKAISDVVEALEAPYTMTLASRLEKLGFERVDVHDGGVVVERYRRLGSGYGVFLRHAAMPVRRAWIDRESTTALQRAWFTKMGKKVGATSVPSRVYSEGVRLLRALTGAS